MNLRPPPVTEDINELRQWCEELYEFLKYPAFHKVLFVPNGSVTWNPGSLLDGEGETVQVTVTGASLGDFVIVSAPYDLQDCIVTGYVQATDTVEIRLQNESGATVDLGSGTWKVMVLRQS